MWLKSVSAFVVIASLISSGCGAPSHGSQSPFQSVEWKTYQSPDGRVSFNYPSDFKVSIVPRKSADAPQLALSMESSDGSADVTLILRVSDEVKSDYCDYMHDMTLRHPNTIAISQREPVKRGDARGLRQEFRDGSGWAAKEFIAVTLEAGSAHVHFTSGYSARSRDHVRPICQRIVESLTLSP